MRGSFTISWGRYGGFYFHKGFSTRLCLGWVAFTYFPQDLDVLIKLWKNKSDRKIVSLDWQVDGSDTYAQTNIADYLIYRDYLDRVKMYIYTWKNDTKIMYFDALESAQLAAQEHFNKLIVGV